jgi:hypothetical protein
VVFRDAIWVMGGQTMPGYVRGGAPEAFYNDVWRSRDGVAWERVDVEGDCWEPRGMIGGAAVLDGRMWILGGGTYDTPTTPTRRYYHDAWSTADGVHWTCHTRSAPWPARSYHDVAVFDSRLWVIGGHYPEAGEPARNHADVWHAADGIFWEELPDTPWAPRHAASLFVHDDALWVVAGNNMESDVWRLVRT